MEAGAHRPSHRRHRSADGTSACAPPARPSLFDGFLKLYREDGDEPNDDEESRRLPALPSATL